MHNALSSQQMVQHSAPSSTHPHQGVWTRRSGGEHTAPHIPARTQDWPPPHAQPSSKTSRGLASSMEES